MKQHVIEKSDIKVIRKSLLNATILAICSLVVSIGMLSVCNTIVENQANFDLIFYLKIIFCGLFLFGFLYIMKIYLTSSFNQIKDIKNGIKYSFETIINKKEIVGADSESSGIPFIYTPKEEFKEFQISQKQYDNLREGDKVYIETLPISKMLLKITKI